MKATSIPVYEESFETSGVDAVGKKFILSPEEFKIKGTNEHITIIDCIRENKDKSYYYQEQTTKKKIIIHYTMGFLKGDIAQLTKGHISVPFVIGRNGNIYNLFPSKYWSYHLGPDAIGGNEPMSKESIGIELSNIGPLKSIGNNLVTTYSDSDVYCSIDEQHFYTKLPTKYRKFEYYAKFTESQYVSLIKLIKFLCRKYNLPSEFIDISDRYNLLSKKQFKAFSGIASHVNCRDDKTDIGPAFDWDRIINEIKLME